MSKEKFTKKDLCDMDMTHLVYKKSDLWRVQTTELMDSLIFVDSTYMKSREEQGKNQCPTYIVINTDEPYINEIIDVLKKNNNWDL